MRRGLHLSFSSLRFSDMFSELVFFLIIIEISSFSTNLKQRVLRDIALQLIANGPPHCTGGARLPKRADEMLTYRLITCVLSTSFVSAYSGFARASDR